MEGIKVNSVMERGKEDHLTSFLPEDLVFNEILSKLPVKSLLRLKSVSKSWSTRISGDSSFIIAHLTQQTKTDLLSLVHGVGRKPMMIGLKQMMILLSDQRPKATEYIDTSHLYAGEVCIDFVGSCNGLVCFTQYGYPNLILLWNPATRQVRRFPWFGPAKAILAPCSRGIGFGFDNASKDYKVVQLSNWKRSSQEEWCLCTQVFTKSSAAWRESGSLGKMGKMGASSGKRVVAVEGALHWVVRMGSRTYVVSFDLQDEVLRSADGPADEFGLCKWRDFLAASTHYSTTEWIMWASTSFGGIRHWRKMLKFTWDIERSIQVWREQFLVSVNPIGLPSSVMLVDLNAPGLESHFKLPDNCVKIVSGCDYVESLFSLF